VRPCLGDGSTIHLAVFAAAAFGCTYFATDAYTGLRGRWCAVAVGCAVAVAVARRWRAGCVATLGSVGVLVSLPLQTQSSWVWQSMGGLVAGVLSGWLLSSRMWSAGHDRPETEA